MQVIPDLIADLGIVMAKASNHLILGDGSFDQCIANDGGDISKGPGARMDSDCGEQYHG